MNVTFIKPSLKTFSRIFFQNSKALVFKRYWSLRGWGGECRKEEAHHSRIFRLLS